MNIFDVFDLSFEDAAVDSFFAHCFTQSELFTRQFFYEIGLRMHHETTFSVHPYLHMRTVVIAAMHKTHTDVLFVHFDAAPHNHDDDVLQQLHLQHANTHIVYIGHDVAPATSLRYDAFLQPHWNVEHATLQLLFQHFQQTIRMAIQNEHSE